MGFVFRVWGFGFRVSGLGFGVSCFRLRILGFGYRVWNFGYRVWGLGFEFGVSSFGFDVLGFRFQVTGFGLHLFLSKNTKNLHKNNTEITNNITLKFGQPQNLFPFRSSQHNLITTIATGRDIDASTPTCTTKIDATLLLSSKI